MGERVKRKPVGLARRYENYDNHILSGSASLGLGTVSKSGQGSDHNNNTTEGYLYFYGGRVLLTSFV